MPNQFPGTARPDFLEPLQETTLNPEEKVLAESQQRRLLALEAAGVGTWSWDLTTNEIAWDSRCKALFGLPEASSDITFQDFLLHLHPHDRKLTEDAIQHISDEKRDYDVIHRVIWPDESIHWLRCKGQFGKGLPTQVIGLAIEVTWLKHREEEHFLIEDRLRRAQEELEQRVHERTAELEQRTTEYSPPECAPRTVSQVTGVAAVSRPVRRILYGPRSVVAIHLGRQSPDGSCGLPGGRRAGRPPLVALPHRDQCLPRHVEWTRAARATDGLRA